MTSSAASLGERPLGEGELPFGELSATMLGALVFELASQLHVERARRLALEAALAERGVLQPADIEASGANPACRKKAAHAADLAVRKLLRVLSESADERAPLRAEAPRSVAGES